MPVMSMRSGDFRRILSHLPTGVTIVTAAEPEGEARGLTASAVAAVSLDPPLVLACVDRGSDTHACIERTGAFAINVLAEGDRELAERFAELPAAAKFDGVPHRPEATGAPILDAALSWADCRVWARYPGGDHTIFVGEVLAGDAGPGCPLVHFRGGYRSLAP